MAQRFIPFLFLISSLLYSAICFSQSHDLNYYLQNGIENSPLLRDYTNQLQRNKIDSLLILAGRKIVLSATGQIIIAPIINGYGYDEAITNKGQYTAVVGIRKTLLQKNYFTAQTNRLRLRSDSLLTNQLVSRRTLEKAITDQYLNCYDTLLQIKFQEQVITSLENQLILLEPLVRNGIYLQTDYLTLKLQIQTEKINLQLLKDGYRSTIYVLNALSGIFDTTVFEVPSPNLIWKTSTASFNPNLILFSLDSLSIESSKSLLKYNYVPKLNLWGDAGYQAIPADPTFKKFGFSAGVSFDWIISDGGQRNLRLQQLNIQQQNGKFYRNFYRTQYSLQLANLEKKMQSSNSIVVLWQDELQDMNLLMLMRRQQLVSGQLSIIDYLAAMRTYRDLQQKLNAAVIQQQRIINEHNYLVW